MSRSSKVVLVSVATFALMLVAFSAGASLFIAPCSSGYNYRLLIALFPFVALLLPMAPISTLLVLLAALCQYPAYGWLVGWVWVKCKPLLAVLVPLIHVVAVISAKSILWNRL
jgi:hypothetical protein